MNTDFANKLLHINLLHRGVALLFFILIFADIASPELCCEELNDISSSDSSYTFIQSSNNPHHSITADIHSQKKDEHSKCASSDDGYFCCCAHFIVSRNLFISIQLFEQPNDALVYSSLPIPPHRSMFHPPRSA